MQCMKERKQAAKSEEINAKSMMIAAIVGGSPVTKPAAGSILI